jgi:hypothetical protein
VAALRVSFRDAIFHGRKIAVSRLLKALLKVHNQRFRCCGAGTQSKTRK